jgi:DNA helicase-2/ATP-dependent DNA helicase PcrA
VDNFAAVRELADLKHSILRARTPDASATALLSAARAETGIAVKKLPLAHPLLAGGDGALYRESKAIYIATDLDPDVAGFVEAHEFGHYWIETPGEPVIVPKGADPSGPEEGTPLGLKRVEAYSAKELREQLANVFGREFLLPRSEARRLFVEEKTVAPEIAKSLNLPIGLVHQQLAVALLMPDPLPESDEATSDAEKLGLDASQRIAAEHEGSPLLVEAGPGTGKTRTLIARIEHLLKRGVPASSILALTFSNKAAREIRERVALTMPDAAREMWAGTFHAFGLELLRKYGHLADVTEHVRLFDQADQLEMLEKDLLALELDHYLRLSEPLSDIRPILGAVSRAKDEMKSASDYTEAAIQYRRTAKTDDERLKAEKAIEVARVYTHYERRMREEKAVDFADLIGRPLEIFRQYPAIQADLRAKYQHVLVDEYQDVNRASAMLVKTLAGDGDNLWVVGDAKQSIYRFRGASPLNTRDFEKDYSKGRRKSLSVNYRSRKEIVDAFGTYSATMHVGGGRASPLEAKRGPSPAAIDFNVAINREAEIAGIAGKIKRYVAEGIAYRDQAVLCRTHSQLESVAKGIEAAGVPILYLGDLFERPEVRDLLALISFVAEPRRGGLIRVAGLQPYQIPLSDVRAFLANLGTLKKRPHEALELAGALIGVSESGRKGLARLARDVEGVEFKTRPGSFLCHVLFNRRDLLSSYLGGNSAAEKQRRLAIHQILQFAIENDRSEGPVDPKRRMLAWIRRLESFGDEKALREPPAAIAGIDAVRLMTVHSSKGLEFKALHVPILGSGMFPLSRQGERCPSPPGLLPTSAVDDHKEEEQCLFFVALSRAKDRLSLSRAERYSDKRRSKPSDALNAIARHLPRAPSAPSTWTSGVPLDSDETRRPDLAVTSREHDGRDLEQFEYCPRQYLYQRVLNLSGGRDDTAYVQFHLAIYQVLRWFGEKKGDVSLEETAAVFETAWREVGPHDHSLEPLYRKSAELILDQARNRMRPGTSFSEKLTLRLGDQNVTVLVDEVDRSGHGFTVRRLRTGRPPKDLDQRMLHAIMYRAACDTIGGSGRFDVHYLTTNEAVDVSLDRVTTDRLNDALQILGRLAVGHFPAKPKSRENCPRCPHYFICPSVPT